MNPYRAILAAAAAVAVLLGLANAFVWHSAVSIPIVFYAVLVFVLARFEVGRYRPKLRASGVFVATGERFFDPVTGADTVVYYDAASGERDYRTPTAR